MGKFSPRSPFLPFSPKSPLFKGPLCHPISHVVKALTNFRHINHFHFFLSKSPLSFKRLLCHFIWIFAKTLVGVHHICHFCQICHLCQNSPLNPLVFFHWICHCCPVFTVFAICHFCHNRQSPRGHVLHPNWIFTKPIKNFCQICRSRQIRHFRQLLYFTGSTSRNLIYAPVNVGGGGWTYPGGFDIVGVSTAANQKPTLFSRHGERKYSQIPLGYQAPLPWGFTLKLNFCQLSGDFLPDPLLCAFLDINGEFDKRWTHFLFLISTLVFSWLCFESDMTLGTYIKG